jgi:hypothetical protein
VRRAAGLVLLAVLALGVAVGEALTPSTEHVLLVGDSIMRQTGPALTRQVGDRFTVHNEGVNGSGLLTPGVFDWPDHLAQDLARTDPDVVVMLFIGNYTDDPAELWVTPDGERVANVNSPAFAREWGRQVDAATAAIADRGATVVLVLPPPMAVAELQSVVAALRAEYERVAADWDFVRLADATEAVGGPNGEWVADLPAGDGSLRPVRVPDTVHLAEHGQRLVAREIAGKVRGLSQAG